MALLNGRATRKGLFNWHLEWNWKHPSQVVIVDNNGTLHGVRVGWHGNGSPLVSGAPPNTPKTILAELKTRARLMFAEYQKTLRAGPLP